MACSDARAGGRRFGLAWTTSLSLALVAGSFAAACGDSNDTPSGCADGTVAQADGGCAAPADAAPEDAGVAETSAAAPTFAGPTEVAPAGATKVLVTWAPATDPVTKPEQMRYAIFVGESASAIDYRTPVGTSAPGADVFVIDGLEINTPYFVGVRALNAANVSDANTVKKSVTTADDSEAPTFAGVKSATSAGGGTVTLTWDAALDNLSPAAVIRYDVFAVKGPGLPDFAAPTFTTSPGATTASVPNLDTPDTDYTFVVRARDAADNVDSNTVTATTVVDTTPPTFAGLTGSILDSAARSVTLSWAAATDDKAAASDIVYDVYEASSTLAEVFTGAPRASSVPGALSVTVTDLAPDASLFWVVRARDRAGNHDSNTVEQSGITFASYALQIQKLFTEDCAVVGCHVPGNPPAGLILSRGFSYDLLVGVNAAEKGALFRVAPNDSPNSYLYQKITAAPGIVGSQMPAPNTNSTLLQEEKDLVARWIDQGAPNN